MTKPTGGALGRPISEKVAQAYQNPEPMKTYPRKPTGLQVAGKKAWDDVWSSGRVNETEYALVAEYCFLVDEVANARKVVKGLAQVWHIVGTNGALQPHPAVQHLKDLRQALLNFQRELIMSPASRVKANMEIEKQADTIMEDFINRTQAARKARDS